MDRWAKPKTAGRRRRWWEPSAASREIAWLPRYLVSVPTTAEVVWEVWLCGVDGSLIERPLPSRELGPGLRAVLERREPPQDSSLLRVPRRLDAASAEAAARGQLARSAHALRLEAGLSGESAAVETWWFPVHLEIYRRRGRGSWALRAEDALSGRAVSRAQSRALLDQLMVDQLMAEESKALEGRRVGRA